MHGPDAQEVFHFPKGSLDPPQLLARFHSLIGAKRAGVEEKK